MIRHYTRDILADAAEELFEVKPIQDISVQDIVDACETTRTTFYRYFKDKYDIMNWVYARKVDSIIKNYIDSDTMRQMYYDILSYIEQKKQYYGSIVKYSGQNSFYDYMVNYGTEFYEKRIIHKTGCSAVDSRMHSLVQGYCYGSGYLIIDWVKKGCNINVKELADLIIDLAPAPIAGYLN